jgi:hypothetical protein
MDFGRSAAPSSISRITNRKTGGGCDARMRGAWAKRLPNGALQIEMIVGCQDIRRTTKQSLATLKALVAEAEMVYDRVKDKPNGMWKP